MKIRKEILLQKFVVGNKTHFWKEVSKINGNSTILVMKIDYIKRKEKYGMLMLPTEEVQEDQKYIPNMNQLLQTNPNGSTKNLIMLLKWLQLV